MRMKWTACVAILCSAPVFAQSGAATFALDRTSFAPAHEYVAADAIPRYLSLPSNLIVPAASYRPLLERMLLGSPTFRRQCLRISGEPRVTVVLNMGAPFRRSQTRASTRITRDGTGRLTAVIDVSPLDDDVELIAHEIEHVIEQLDEVDLASHAEHGGTGVRRLSEHVFETARATRMGRQVTREVLAFTGHR